MTCKNCGYVSSEKVLSCPKCGARTSEVDIPNNIKVNNNVETEELQTSTDTAVFPVLIGLVLIAIIVSFGLIIYMDENNNEYETNQNSNVIKYRENGYSFIDLYEDIDDLDRFSLINENYLFIDKPVYDASNLFGNMLIDNKIEFRIENGILIIEDKDTGYSKVVTSINDARYVTGYNKSQCERVDYNIAVVTKDGYAYIYEGTNFSYNTTRELIDAIAAGFKEIVTSKRIRSMAIASYVGEVNPCGEKTLVLLDERNETFIYREGKYLLADANYSTTIYSVGEQNGKNYSIYINPDRTMQIGTEYSEENRYITDSNANKLKYYGMFKEQDSKEMMLLTTNGYLYTINLANDLSNPTVALIRNLDVKYIGYKFDMYDMKNKYAIIYNDGSVREYSGSFETHGIFSSK